MKNIILGISVFGVLVMMILRNSVVLGLCSYNDFSCRGFADDFEHILYVFPIILFFSLVTYFVKDSVFQTWWKFARIAVPVVLLISFIISLELHHTPGGWFNVDNEVDIVYLTITYLVFSIGSVIAIVRGYRKESSLN